MSKEINLEAIIENWKKRNLIKEITSIENLKWIIQNKKSVYCGIDPTYDSLHLGHLIPLKLLKEFSILGCPIIVLLGGATGEVGDPSFQKQKRKNLVISQIQKNIIQIQTQILKLLPKVKLVNNLDWYQKFNILDFFKNVSSLFTVKKMLQKESFAQAFKENILFHHQFSYILLQAYDFYYLWKNYDCHLQIGGSDQFPNIVFGIDLIRKKTTKKILVCGITTNLLLDENGHKISKSSNQTNIWLSVKKNSFYQIFQFFYNLNDQLIQIWINLFDVEFSKKLSSEDFKTRKPQKNLFFYIITWIFGSKINQQIKQCLSNLQNNVLSFEVLKLMSELNFINQFLLLQKHTHQTDIISLLLWTNMADSKISAKKLIMQKAIKINKEILNKNDFIFNLIPTNTKIFTLKKGKKEIILIKIK